jgi:hypothetical protein
MSCGNVADEVVGEVVEEKIMPRESDTRSLLCVADKQGGRTSDAPIEAHANDVKRQRHYTSSVQLRAAREYRPSYAVFMLNLQAMLPP